MNKLSTKVEFIQAIGIDINGFARGKTFPVSKLSELFKGKEEMVNVLGLVGTRNEVPLTLEDITDNGFFNVYLVPDKETLQMSPWCNDDSMALVFYDTYNIATNTPLAFNPRLLAKQKLKELKDIGYDILIGVENEFRLFNKATKEPISNVTQLCGHTLARSTVLPFVRRLNKKLKEIDIEIDSWYLEVGKGQLEIPLKPYVGIDGIDKVWIFRELSKYIAEEMDMMASYMTTPLAKDISSGMHINHSLLRSIDQVNAMQSDREGCELSEIGKHWLAGLIKHGRALSAFTNPTVNCYRRILNGNFAPKIISWNYYRRDCAFRVKTNAAMTNATYIENRITSSASNIYLGVAAMIVAGLDGIKNKLSLIEPGTGDHCEALPVTLEEALRALRDDSVLVEGMGTKFVDWYTKAKLECDVNVLKHVDLTIDTSEGLLDEVYKYLIL